jgi:regulatory protein
MPTITKLEPTRRNPNRRSIHLDGQFAFAVNLNVVAKFKLREGQTLTPEQVEQIQQGELRQEALDTALKFIQLRLHSRAELKKKLARKEFGDAVIESVLEDLTRLGYLDDARFARNKALYAAQHKHHGRRRAYVELLKSGVRPDTANAALDDVYSENGAGGDSTAAARLLAEKQAPRLKRLDPQTARRRLAAMLQRRGFDYETIKPVIDQVLRGEPGEE